MPGIVNAVRDGFAHRIGGEIVILYGNGLLTPAVTIVFEVSDEFLFLGVDADDRFMMPGKFFSQLCNMNELLISFLRIRRICTGFKGLAVNSQGIPQFLKQSADSVGADRDA